MCTYSGARALHHACLSFNRPSVPGNKQVCWTRSRSCSGRCDYLGPWCSDTLSSTSASIRSTRSHWPTLFSRYEQRCR